MVDDRHRRHGDDEVHQADNHRLLQGRLRASPRHLEDVGRVVNHHVDARKLIEHRDRHGQQDWLGITAAEERLFQRVMGQIERGLDFADFVFHVAGVRAATPKHVAGLVHAAFGHQPAWALRRDEQEQEERRRGKGHDAEHPAIVNVAQGFAGDISDHEIREICQQDAQHDVELLERHQPAAVLGGGDFGDVHGRDDRRPAYRQSAE